MAVVDAQLLLFLLLSLHERLRPVTDNTSTVQGDLLRAHDAYLSLIERAKDVRIAVFFLIYSLTNLHRNIVGIILSQMRTAPLRIIRRLIKRHHTMSSLPQALFVARYCLTFVNHCLLPLIIWFWVTFIHQG